ncbi:DUF6968 family protein [Solimonas flava]|uniref:DUF6968 family protein n=1 Tax=Solimonas flava TaxID=415849 RepID=UPI0012B666EF|nr:hypothetical protein [Solimonas flava]
MKEFVPLKQVVACRELEFVHSSDGSKEAVLVSIGVPFEEEKDIQWRCPYTIEAPSFKKSFGVAGADSMQALLLTVSIMSSELKALEKRHSGVFTQYGEPATGFPERLEGTE